jgi:hypothetical protein
VGNGGEPAFLASNGREAGFYFDKEVVMLYRRPYKIRKANSRDNTREVTVPRDASFKTGQKVVVLSNGYMLVVAEGTVVNEALLEKAIRPK